MQVKMQLISITEPANIILGKKGYETKACESSSLLSYEGIC
jgi:hypothetical protein